MVITVVVVLLLIVMLFMAYRDRATFFSDVLKVISLILTIVLAIVAISPIGK